MGDGGGYEQRNAVLSLEVSASELVALQQVHDSLLQVSVLGGLLRAEFDLQAGISCVQTNTLLSCRLLSNVNQARLRRLAVEEAGESGLD